MTGTVTGLARETVRVDIPAPILIAVADEDRSRRIARQLSDALPGITCTFAASAPDALPIIEGTQRGVIVVDTALTRDDPYQLAHAALAHSSGIGVVAVLSDESPAALVEAFDRGVDDVLRPGEELVPGLTPVLVQRAWTRAQDRLARLAAEQALLETAEALTASLAELNSFSHTVAHRVKNLLAANVGYSEYIYHHEKDLNPKYADALYRMFVNGKKAAEIIDDLVLLATPQRTNAPMRAFGMADVLRYVQRRERLMIEDLGAEVTWPKRAPRVTGYPPWIEEAWVILLRNALVYGGDPPRIEIGFDDEPVAGQRRFWIRDFGPGVVAGDIDLLFKPIVRDSDTAESSHGLGLAIARRFVEACGGEIGYTPPAGGGALFWFTLLAAPDDESNEAH